MAADILLYRAALVPVGEDQSLLQPHIPSISHCFWVYIWVYIWVYFVTCVLAGTSTSSSPVRHIFDYNQYI